MHKQTKLQKHEKKKDKKGSEKVKYIRKKWREWKKVNI